MPRDRVDEILDDGLAKTAVSEAPKALERGRGLLTVTTGVEVGRVIPVELGSPLTFGRSEECNVRIPDAGLSRVHARILCMGDEYIVKDMGSTNGTWINDERVDFAAQLHDGDRVRLGGAVTLRFSLVDEEEEEALRRAYLGRRDAVLAQLAELEGRDGTFKDDLLQARDFQLRALRDPPELPGLQLDIVYRPLEPVGGDLYDLVATKSGALRLFIADATGHGVKASLTTMLILSELAQVSPGAAGPAQLLAALSDRIAVSYAHLAVRFTALCAELDPRAGRLRYATAAHPALWVVHDGKARELQAGGTFMGLVGGAEFPEWTETLAKGDALMALTDGVSEARVADDTFDTRLAEALQDAWAGSGPIAAAVAGSLDAFAAESGLSDDVTLIGVRWLG